MNISVFLPCSRNPFFYSIYTSVFICSYAGFVLRYAKLYVFRYLFLLYSRLIHSYVSHFRSLICHACPFYVHQCSHLDSCSLFTYMHHICFCCWCPYHCVCAPLWFQVDHPHMSDLIVATTVHTIVFVLLYDLNWIIHICIIWLLLMLSMSMCLSFFMISIRSYTYGWSFFFFCRIYPCLGACAPWWFDFSFPAIVSTQTDGPHPIEESP